MEEDIKKILLIDFDGVLHSYLSGWQGARNIPDAPVTGAIEWLRHLLILPVFKVCIYSSRSRQWGGKRAMREWLLKNGLERVFLRRISFPTKKPAAFLTIDDRCLRFEGRFPTESDMLSFRAWRCNGAMETPV